ncbi:helix-turn-helix transcriptional regulator [Candidatus Fermentibacteria bacterium]|nr:helix-turn-helix transcriptional regulator [Candidatus Fermentibacteria bacterium]
MKLNGRHWTAENAASFRFAVADNFVTQVQMRLDELGLQQSHLAERLGIHESRVSQVLNNPGNLTLGTMVRLVRALEMKLAAVAYDDGDAGNERGPIHPEVFRLCWEALGKPADRWEFEGAVSASAAVWHQPWDLKDLADFVELTTTPVMARPFPISADSEIGLAWQWAESRYETQTEGMHDRLAA